MESASGIAKNGLVTYAQKCPLCDAAIYRIHRRMLDLAFSFFIPIRRYRCGSMGCHWEGNLRRAPVHKREKSQ